MIDEIVEKLPINIVVPQKGYFHSFFKNKISGVGRSLQGLISDILSCSNSEEYFIELFDALRNNEIIIDKPLYVWFHSKTVISTKSQKKRLHDREIENDFSDYILLNPVKRDVYELTSREKDFFENVNEIEPLGDLLDKISKSFSDDPLVVLQKWEQSGVVRYSFVQQVNYHALIDKNYDYSCQPMILHHIDKPEFKFFRIVLTERCSLSCIYCYYNSHKEIARNVMSRNQLFNTLDYILDISLKNGNKDTYVQWWGGDPAEEEQLVIEGSEYCKKIFSQTGIKLHFSICSSFVSGNTHRFFDYLIENDFHITISLDGDKKTHNFHKPHMYGCDSYDEVINSHQYLKKNFPQITQLLENKELHIPKGRIKCRCTIFENIFDYSALCDFFNAFDQSYRICLVSDENTINNKKIFRKQIVEQIKTYQEQAIEIYLERQPKGKLSPIFCNAITNPQNALKFIFARCGFAGGIIIINPQGALFTCHRFCDIEDMRIGVIGDSYDSILNRTMKLRERWNLNFDKCRNCCFKSLCSGNCAYESYANCGDVWKTASCIDLELIKEKTLLYYIMKKLFPDELKINMNIEDCACVRNLWC